MSQNPYQPPEAAGPALASMPFAPPGPVDSYPGPWRHGKLMVVYKHAQFPDICVVSNQPAQGSRLRRNLSWHHPALLLTVFAGVLVYVIVAVILTKRASLEIAMTREWIIRRRRRIAIAWIIGLSSVAAFIGGIALIDNRPGVGGWLLLLAAVGFLGSLFYGVIACPLIRPARISANYVWLKGVHRDYLSQLPEWTYGYSV